MIKGLYTSALGMTTQMKRLDVVSNNIANANTTGFKKDLTITSSFSEELEKRLDDRETFMDRHASPVGRITYGLFVDTVHTDFSVGNMQNTGNPLDTAISGDGFYSISVTDRNGAVTEKYTRDGAFTLSPDRRLVTKEGNAVNGQNGPITLPDGEISFGDLGQVYVNSEYIDTLRLVNIDNPDSLRKQGDNLYNPTDETTVSEFRSFVMQGIVENSNVNPVKEMVEMINITRNYEANQRMVTIHDNILGRAVSDIGRR